MAKPQAIAKKPIVSTVVDRATREQLKRQATETDRSLSDYVRLVLEEHLRDEEDERG